MEAIRASIGDTMAELNAHNARSNATRMALSKLEYEVGLLSQKREYLRRAIQEHESKGPDAVIHVPFNFFEELHKEHARILESLDKKITEAENLAKEVFSQTNSASPAS